MSACHAFFGESIRLTLLGLILVTDPLLEKYANLFGLFGTNLRLPFSIQYCDKLNWDASVFCSVKLMG